MTCTDNDRDKAFGSARVSSQRREIVSATLQLGGAFTVDELVRAVHASDAGVGTATVYRAVSALEGSGWLERVGVRDGSALFARCEAGAEHHHHVVCEGCGRVEATECTVSGTGAPADGFLITRHEVTLYGLCPACSAGTNKRV